MISFIEFEIAVRGLLRLARFDAGFAGFFDLSQDGARRSFRLALPLLPLYLAMLHINTTWPADADLARVVFAETIGYVVMWAAFPLLLIGVGRVIDRTPKVWGAIAVYNWLSVLSMALQLPIVLAIYSGLSGDLGLMLGLLALGFVIACEYFAFRRLLDIGIEMTIALVLVDFILGQAIIAVRDLVAQGPLF